MGKYAVRLVPEHSSTNRTVIAVAVAVFLLAFIVFIVGVVLVSKKSCEENVTVKTISFTNTSQRSDPKCRYSEEALRVGLPSFLDKVKSYYYEYNRDNIAWDPDLRGDRLREAKLYW